jgi:hypothetical protein
MGMEREYKGWRGPIYCSHLYFEVKQTGHNILTQKSRPCDLSDAL